MQGRAKRHKQNSFPSRARTAEKINRRITMGQVQSSLGRTHSMGLVVSGTIAQWAAASVSQMQEHSGVDQNGKGRRQIGHFECILRQLTISRNRRIRSRSSSIFRQFVRLVNPNPRARALGRETQVFSGFTGARIKFAKFLVHRMGWPGREPKSPHLWVSFWVCLPSPG